MPKELKKESKIIEPTVRIGKNGLTDAMIKEIKKNLKKRRLLKIKMLNSFIEGKNRKELAKDIAEKTNTILIDCIGSMVTICRK